VPAPANSSPRLASVRALLELAALAGAPLRYGHMTRILRDGALAFPTMLAAIRAARTSVCFENFILAHDATGEEFARGLVRARARGAQVRVLYDPIGTLLVRLMGPLVAVVLVLTVVAVLKDPLALVAQLVLLLVVGIAAWDALTRAGVTSCFNLI